MRVSEWVACVYFAGMTVAAWVRSVPRARRVRITSTGVAMCALIATLARVGATTARDWAPLLTILAGYVLSGWFFTNPSARFERWLLDADRRVLGDPPARFARWPRLLLAYMELVYVGCFLLVPAGFAALAASGRSDLADRYWTIVGAAEFGAFAPLCVVATRPPWAVERPAMLRDRGVHQFAAAFVRRFTHRANTFPSGHAAGSLAVALAVIGTMPLGGALLLFLAVTICISTIVGRYHYVVDVVGGAALAIAIWAAVELFG